MNDIKDFKDLIVWQKAMDLTVEVYQLVKKLPKEDFTTCTPLIIRDILMLVCLCPVQRSGVIAYQGAIP